jgi:hypothetical protein
MIIKESQSLEQIMPAVYNKLKSLGEINNVVPLDKIIRGLQSGSARAFVSNKDRNEDGIPDDINIVYPTIDIDLSQSLSGITSADITAFPNVDSQKAYHVLNVLAATLEVLQHEQDHLSGFKSTESESGISEEFGSESSAHQAGHTAAQNFLNKWKNTIDSTINKGSSRKTIHINFEGDYEMRKELVKLANHLDRLGHRDLSDRIDSVLQKAAASSVLQKAATSTAHEDKPAGSQFSSNYYPGSIFEKVDNDTAKVIEPGTKINSGWKGKNFGPSAPNLWAAYSIGELRPSNDNAVASGPVNTQPESPADDQLTAQASDDSLDGIFSVNPIGLVSR